jgi:hypothetical protein
VEQRDGYLLTNHGSPTSKGLSRTILVNLTVPPAVKQVALAGAFRHRRTCTEREPDHAAERRHRRDRQGGTKDG